MSARLKKGLKDVLGKMIAKLGGASKMKIDPFPQTRKFRSNELWEVAEIQ